MTGKSSLISNATTFWLPRMQLIASQPTWIVSEDARLMGRNVQAVSQKLHAHDWGSTSHISMDLLMDGTYTAAPCPISVEGSSRDSRKIESEIGRKEHAATVPFSLCAIFGAKFNRTAPRQEATRLGCARMWFGILTSNPLSFYNHIIA